MIDKFDDEISKNYERILLLRNYLYLLLKKKILYIFLKKIFGIY